MTLVITFFDDGPIHDLPKGVQLRSPPILIVEVIGVFPDIEGQQRFIAFGDRVVGIGFLRDHQSAVGLGREPGPAGAEKAGAFGFEFGFESFKAPPLFLDLGFETPGRLRCPVRPGMTIVCTELRKVQVVIQDLPGVIENAAFGFADDFFEGHILERSAGNQFVEIVDVGLEVFAVVEGKGLGTDDRFEGIRCVREFDEFMHCFWFFRVLCRVPGSGSSG